MLTQSGLAGGCYRIRIQTTGVDQELEGTLRVDQFSSYTDHAVVISGDLYICQPEKDQEQPDRANSENPLNVSGIPIFPRSSYHSYLDFRSVATSSARSGMLQLAVDEYIYVPPSLRRLRGSFPPVPSRSFVLDLGRTSLSPITGKCRPRFEGRLLLDNENIGTVQLELVSPYLRRATLVIHVLSGAAAPQPVNDENSVIDYFDSVFARTGWQLIVKVDQTDIAGSSSLSRVDRWTDVDLFRLLERVRKPTENQDVEWHVHLLIVPTGMEAGLGVMFDESGREGAASFSDGYYSRIDSASYGSAAGMRQRHVPRAFLRSALHEVTHAFNQIDQHRGSGDDNSIMTTTSRLADILTGYATASPERFPGSIRLEHNAEVRHYLNHLPDPVVRPGGWPFQSWRGVDVPGRVRRAPDFIDRAN